MNQAAVAQAYARLSALKTNLPERYGADQSYIQEFHTVLDILQKESGVDLSASRVPESEIERESSGSNTLSGEVYYTGRMVCTRSYLMMKIDGVLGFFTLASSRTTVGFTPS